MWKDCTMIKKIKDTDWWEVSYLIIYAIIFSKEFLQTTMFPIPWPLGLGYVFALMSGGYVIAKFLFHNTYTKKEMVLAALVLIAFCVPALTTEYTFLFWTGCLIVGAKDVDFHKILKVYLVLSVTFLVAAISASQAGLIENLQYLSPREDAVYFRSSLGCIYPTDYAAHWFFIVLAIVVLYEGSIKLTTVMWMCLLTAFSVYMTANAQTTTLCLFGFAMLCVLERLIRKYMPFIERIARWISLVCAAMFIGLTYAFDPAKAWMSKLDTLLSFRLKVSKVGTEDYPITLFGQYVDESGLGLSSADRDHYFFLDDSYIRILLKYGVVLLIVTLLLCVFISKRAAEKKRYVLAMALVAIAIHSIMEHRLIDMAYNPMMLAIFAMLVSKEQSNIKINIEK